MDEWVPHMATSQEALTPAPALALHSLVSDLGLPGFGPFKPVLGVSEIQDGLSDLLIGGHHERTYGRKTRSERSGWQLPALSPLEMVRRS